MLRLYIEGVLEPHTRLPIPSAPTAHIRARRVGDGQRIVVFNGEGIEGHGRLIATSKREYAVEIDTLQVGLGYAAPETTLALSIIANDRMDVAIQKACELGVSRVLPLLAARSQAPGNAAKRVPHWQAVAISAAEQCGRARVAMIAPPLPLLDALQSAAPARWLFAQRDEVALEQVIVEKGAQVIAIGPEGGWTDAEVDAFRAAKALGFSLGRATLRAETAAIAALAKRLNE
jgi:16S rRNA (uracil1498-N3)-methyltransferase